MDCWGCGMRGISMSLSCRYRPIELSTCEGILWHVVRLLPVCRRIRDESVVLSTECRVLSAEY